MPTKITVPTLSVDVGYFSTKIALARDTSAQGNIRCVAFPSIAPRIAEELARPAATRALDVVTIDVDGTSYAIGKDASRLSKGEEFRQVQEAYCLTAGYKALFLGALHTAAKELLANSPAAAELEILHLTVGLPQNTIQAHARSLKKLCLGQHKLPPLRTGHGELIVTVKNVYVMSQGYGGWLYLSSSHPKGSMLDQCNLLLDMGGGTCDWFLCSDQKPWYERCGAHPSGMLNVAFRVCDRIHPSLRDEPESLAAVDRAISSGAASFKLDGRVLELSEFDDIIHLAMMECIDRMMSKIKSLNTVDNILFSGGGGDRLRRAFESIFPQRVRDIYTDTDPIFSNCRGFFLAAENYAFAKA